MGEFMFLHPEMFLYLFLPSVVLLVAIFTRKSRRFQAFDKKVLEALEQTGKYGMDKGMRNALLFAALFLMIAAFARPVIDNGEKKIEAKGLTIAVGLDVSLSMTATDLYPDRLTLAKRKIRELGERAAGDKLGVIAFSGGAYLVTPPTDDKETLNYLLKSVDSRAVSRGGSSLKSFLEAADGMLKEEPKIALLFTDGDDGDLEEETALAKEKGIVLYVVGMGREEGSPIPDGPRGMVKDDGGNIVITRLNPHLADLATGTGGAYVDAALDDGDIKALYGEIRRSFREKEFDAKTVRDATELFPWFLGAALFLLLTAFHSFPRKEGAALALAALFLFLPREGNALNLDVETMKEADAAYRAGEYDKAASLYESLKDTNDGQEARRLHNLGNTRFQSGHYEEAIREYEESLKVRENPDTRHNLELAKKKLEEQKQQEQQQQDQQNQDQNQDQQSQDQQQDQDGQKSDQDQQQEGQQDPQQSGDEKEQQDEASQKPEEQQDQQEPKEEKQMNESREDAPDSGEQKEARQLSQEDLTDMEEGKWMERLEQHGNPLQLQKLHETKEADHGKFW